MNIEVEKIHSKDWAYLSEDAHLIAFQELRPVESERIDFALVAKRMPDKLMGYITCREHDSETLYWQFGGAFPGTRESSLTFKAYQKFVDFCQTRYKRVTTIIENDNVVMLKMAMRVGFRVVGIRFYEGKVLLEHVIEFPQVQN